MTTRSALISGASIAGPALAYWLADAGWDVTVVERAERLRTSGYPVDVRGTAVDVVRRMGLHEQIVARNYHHVPVGLLTPGGRRLCTLDFGTLLNSAAAGDVEITRGALSEVLFAATRERVTYVFDDSIESLTQTDRGVDVTFRHRPPQTVDVVVGADGIHSNVRRLTFGDESQFVRHLGPYAAIWDLPGETFAPGTGFMYSHPGRTAMVERPADGSPARAFLAFVHPAPGTVDRHDADAVVTAVRGAFAGTAGAPARCSTRWPAPRTSTSTPSARSGWTVGARVGWPWSATPPTHRRSCRGRAPASRSPAPTCWPVNWSATTGPRRRSRPTNAGCARTWRRTRTSRCAPTRR
ncbi:FAD-dependent monooxygenase [Mycolicibacterium sp. P1-18]|uniref:FAD-dependent monooxygenase n=1 Tax=Mycolicibacterium sp. P1-18 TaxID=2024615 RepID=UPI00351A92FB